jgi:hypothetical protein
MEEIRPRTRPWLLACAPAFVAALSGSALAHEAMWGDIGRFESAAPGERWIFATNTSRRSAAKEAPVNSKTSMVTVTTPGPGQGGYVHYFVIEFPDGEREIQVGIELPDGRIAWSFPGLGVVVSPFIESGEMQAGGQTHAVRHLYGVRPFRSDAAMLELRKDLWRRVIPWVDDATPYCALTASSSQPCLSCLGLVLRVLYPSRSGGMPALPRDFERSGVEPYFTTDDLLLYQAGLQGKHSLAERMARIDALSLPQNLRDDLVQLVQSLEPAQDSDAPGGATKTAAKRPLARSASKAGQRQSSRKKL